MVCKISCSVKFRKNTVNSPTNLFLLVLQIIPAELARLLKCMEQPFHGTKQVWRLHIKEYWYQLREFWITIKLVYKALWLANRKMVKNPPWTGKCSRGAMFWVVIGTKRLFFRKSYTIWEISGSASNWSWSYTSAITPSLRKSIKLPWMSNCYDRLADWPVNQG